MTSEARPPRVALVTGGGSGIGLATTVRFLADGWSVLVADINPAAAEAALAGAAPADRVSVLGCDVAAEADVEAAVAAALERFGGLGALVNNAGVTGAYGAVDKLAVADWDYTFGVLVRGVFLGIKHATRAFDAAGHGGAIVNVASVAGLSGGVGPQAYSAAKAAVINLTKTTATELAPRLIRVNAVAPGPVFTPILGTSAGRVARVGEILQMTQPWPEAGRAEDVAAAIAFLAGPDARFITGETLVVDGGQTAAGPWEAMTRLADPRGRGLVGVVRASSAPPP